VLLEEELVLGFFKVMLALGLLVMMLVLKLKLVLLQVMELEAVPG